MKTYKSNFMNNVELTYDKKYLQIRIDSISQFYLV